MTFQDLAVHHGFWQLIEFCESLQGPTSKAKICELFHISEKDFYSVLGLLVELGADYHYQEENGHALFMRKGSVEQGSDEHFLQNLSVREKIQMIVFCMNQIDSHLTQHFKEFHEKLLCSSEFESVSQFIEKLTPQFMSGRGKVLSFKRSEDSLLKIERAVFHKSLLSIFSRDQRERKILPFKLMKLDGALTLIGEEVETGECIHLSLRDILSVEEMTEVYGPINSKFEFEDYIDGLRSIKETQVRLILKIDSSLDWNDSIAYQHFGNPCLIKKGNGHMIWAASVEPTEEIFEWISNMGSGVEIIDPSAFKRVYLRYCEDKLSLSA